MPFPTLNKPGKSCPCLTNDKHDNMFTRGKIKILAVPFLEVKNTNILPDNDINKET